MVQTNAHALVKANEKDKTSDFLVEVDHDASAQ